MAHPMKLHNLAPNPGRETKVGHTVTATRLLRPTFQLIARIVA
jgi:hypothetical protein